MKISSLCRPLWYIALLFAVSCAEEQDFDQFNNLSIIPEVSSSIFYFESDEGTINAAGGGTFYEQDFTFEAFNEPFVSERVVNGTITYQIENTTSKPIAASISFLDNAGTVLDTENFAIGEHPFPLLERQVAYGEGGKSLDILRNTTLIRVTGENLGDASSTSSERAPVIIIRSSATFSLELR